MLKTILSFIIIFQSISAISQTLPKRPKIADVRSYNQMNLLSISAKMSRQEVIDHMGGLRQIKIFDPTMVLGQKNVGTISNPYSRDLKTDTSGNQIEILWYYTDKKSESKTINKNELTPIVLENNLVVGIGWGFFEDYAKRKEIFITTNNN